MSGLKSFYQLVFLLFLVLFIALFSFGCKSDDSNSSKVSTSMTDRPFNEQERTAILSSPLLPVLPAPSASSTPPNALLIDTMVFQAPFQQGDHGDEIALIKKMLIVLGFDPGDANDLYEENLQKAIRHFQLYAGLTVDGIAGLQTVSAIADRYEDAITVNSQSYQPLVGLIIGIDPGHQRHDNDGMEPFMPGSDYLKKKVSSGTYGRFTGVPEYVINLQVSLKLRKKLESLGAEVIMTRQTHNVDISNAERALMMNKAGVDCWLRIHINGADNPDVHGMFLLVAEEGFMNTSSDSIYKKSISLANNLLDRTVQATGAKNLGVNIRNDQTGFGWSSVPACNIEMGHMTNEKEDYLLVSEAYQNKIVDGVCSGFLAYYE